MNHLCISEACQLFLDTKCSFYKGSDLPIIGATDGDNLTNILVKIENALNNVITSANGHLILDETNTLFPQRIHLKFDDGLAVQDDPFLDATVIKVKDKGIQDSMLRDSAPLSVIGRPVNSIGSPYDIVSTSDNTLLRRVGGTLDFGALTLNMAPDNLWTYSKIQKVSPLSLLGNPSNILSDITEIGLSSNLTFTGGLLDISSAYTGQFWNLASGGTLTGVNTITSNSPNQLNFTGSWTQASAFDYHIRFTGSLTADSVSGNQLNYISLTPTLTSSATNQNLSVLYFEPTFVDSFSATWSLLRVRIGSVDRFAMGFLTHEDVPFFTVANSFSSITRQISVGLISDITTNANYYLSVSTSTRHATVRIGILPQFALWDGAGSYSSVAGSGVIAPGGAGATSTATQRGSNPFFWMGAFWDGSVSLRRGFISQLMPSTTDNLTGYFYIGNNISDGTTRRNIAISQNGEVLIDTQTLSSYPSFIPNTRLDIRGTGTTTNLTLRLADSSNNETFTVMDKGVTQVSAYVNDNEDIFVAGINTQKGFIIQRRVNIAGSYALYLGTTTANRLTIANAVSGTAYFELGTSNTNGYLFRSGETINITNLFKISLPGSGAFQPNSNTFDRTGLLVDAGWLPSNPASTIAYSAFRISSYVQTSSANTGAVRFIDLNPKIDNISSAANIIYGIDFRPTITSLGSSTLIAFRAIEGQVVIGHTTSIANNRMLLRGIGSGSGKTLLLQDNIGTDTFAFLDDGKMFIYVAPSNATSSHHLLLRDNSTGEVTKLGIGTGLSVSGGNLVSTGGGGLSDGDYGDITVSGGGTVMTIDTDIIKDWQGAHTFRDNVLRVRDSDNTHSYFLRSSNLTANRDITLPLLTANDVFVFEAHSQTLTNKTISALSNTITDIGDSSIAAHTSTKITITNKAQLNSAIVYNDQANVFGDFNQTFRSSRLRISNPANTFFYVVAGSAITAGRNITLPLLTGDDTFVFESHSQTLTNKTISALSNTISDIGDSSIATHTSTKITITNKSQLNSAIAYTDQANSFDDFNQTFRSSRLRVANPANTFFYSFVGSAITANRDVTLPLLTASDTFVFESHTQTLTNKTLGSGTVISAAPTINDDIRIVFNPGTNNAGLNVGAHTANPSSPIDGDIYYNSTANELRARINGAWVNLGAAGSPGGSNHELQKNNSGTFGGTRIFSTTDGNLILGDSTLAGSYRTVNVEGSASNVGFNFISKGTGDFRIDANGGLNVFNLSTSLRGSILFVGTYVTFQSAGGHLLIETSPNNSAFRTEIRGGQGLSGNNDGGDIYLIPGSKSGTGRDGNISLFVTPVVDFQGMGRGLFMGNASSAPTGNPASGLFKWVDSSQNAVKVRNTSGEVYDETPRNGTITIELYNGGNDLTTGIKDTPVKIPYSGRVVAWEIMAYDSSNNLLTTSCVVDVLSDTFSSLPLSGTDSIAGTEKPTLSSQSTNSDTTLTTWSDLVAGNYLQAEIESISSGVAKIVVCLTVKRFN